MFLQKLEFSHIAEETSEGDLLEKLFIEYKNLERKNVFYIEYYLKGKI